ncbi:hypothetical protein PENANT_c057G01798 [Penicillium antarcticum]|uniref:Uncharacterized protein n=1 Tax=Penicillium antarcticum TaxID=416450 RepID=A0A1V6PQE5_9EURO|nr:hypothetical protein PENANT_c057G01798 [Penicillium antarcticum]
MPGSGKGPRPTLPWNVDFTVAIVALTSIVECNAGPDVDQN